MSRSNGARPECIRIERGIARYGEDYRSTAGKVALDCRQGRAQLSVRSRSTVGKVVEAPVLSGELLYEIRRSETFTEAFGVRG